MQERQGARDPEESRPDDGAGRTASPRLSGVAASAMVMILARTLVRGISIVSTLILVRLLAHEDFGIVALTSGAIAITEALTATNYGAILIKSRHDGKEFYDTAWTIHLIRCIAVSIFIIATSQWQADILGDERIAGIMVVVGFTIALDGLNSIGLVKLQKELKFDEIMNLQISHKIVAFLCCMLVALITRNYWCLVIGNLMSRFFVIPYSYWLAPHKPGFSLRYWREFFHFSKWMVLVNACIVAELHGPTFVLARISLAAAGVFQVANQIGTVPVTEIAVPVRAPFYSGYARVSHQPAELRRQFLLGLGYVTMVVTPLSIGIALLAPEIQRVALGPDWSDAAPMIAFCALFALFDAIGAFTSNLFLLLDRIRRYALLYALLMIVRMLAIVWAAALFGVTGVMAALVISAFLGAVVWHWQTCRLLGHSAADVLSHTGRSLGAAVIMACAVIGVRHAVLPLAPGAWGDVLAMALLATVGACVHIGTQYLLWRMAGSPAGAESHLLATASRILGHWRRRLARDGAPTAG